MSSFEYGSIAWRVAIDLLFGLPIYGTYLVGIIVALMRWDRRGSVYVAIAMSIALAYGIGINIVYSVLPLMLQSSGNMGYPGLGFVFGGLRILTGCVNASVWGLVLLVLFRNQPQPHLEAIQIELPADDRSLSN